MALFNTKKQWLAIGLVFLLVGCISRSDNESPIASPTQNVVPTDTPFPTPTEVLETPTPIPTDTPTALPPTPLACLSEGGTTFNDWIESDELPNVLEFRVYLPPCYEVSENHRYPVIYLIHGQTFTHDQWDRIGADEVANEMIAFGGSEPFIMVMPRDRVWTQPSEDGFGRAVVNDLIPYIDATYRTLATREYRAVGGISRGASWAVHLGIGYWELFSVVGLHSLPVFWEDAPFVPKWLDEIPVEDYPRIYMDVASKDEDAIIESSAWFVEQLKKRSIPFEWHLYVGFHEEAYWKENIENYMRFYSRGW